MLLFFSVRSSKSVHQELVGEGEVGGGFPDTSLTGYVCICMCMRAYVRTYVNREILSASAAEIILPALKHPPFGLLYTCKPHPFN